MTQNLFDIKFKIDFVFDSKFTWFLTQNWLDVKLKNFLLFGISIKVCCNIFLNFKTFFKIFSISSIHLHPKPFNFVLDALFIRQSEHKREKKLC